MVDKLKLERHEKPLSDMSRPIVTYNTSMGQQFARVNRSLLQNSGRSKEPPKFTKADSNVLASLSSLKTKAKLYAPAQSSGSYSRAKFQSTSPLSRI